MNYLHIISPSIRVMQGYMMMYKHYFNTSEHTFLTNRPTLPNDHGLLFFDNVIDFGSLKHGKLRKYKAIKSLMNKADVIVFHGLNNISNKWILMMWLNRKLLNKCAWFMWGIDLYNYLLPNKGIKNRFLNHINTFVRKNIKCPCAAFPTDIDAYYKLINNEKKGYFTPNPTSNKSFFEMDKLIEKQEEEKIETVDNIATAVYLLSGKINTEKYHINDSGYLIPNDNKDEKKIRIMVGNNAHSFNRHKDVLNMLEKFSNENIRIVIPANYGEDTFAGSNYVSKLSKYANVLFGPKAECMTKFLSLDQYHSFLASVDVAIFNATRQNALGNIIKLLYMGKKIYLSKKDNPVFDILVEQGFVIHDISELSSITFEDFIAPDDVPVLNKRVLDIFGEKGAGVNWKNMFDEAFGTELNNL